MSVYKGIWCELTFKRFYYLAQFKVSVSSLSNNSQTNLQKPKLDRFFDFSFLVFRLDHVISFLVLKKK